MDGTAELKVAAETEGESFEMSFQGTDGKKIRERLSRMLVPAVACVYYGNQGFHGSNQRSAFLRMTHGCDIRVT